jgi:hypothetical protein
MPLPENVKSDLDSYVRADLAGDVDAHVLFFSFLDGNPDLQRRVGEEYFSARYLYKMWEGLRISDGWARRAQVQLQVQQYASIYEACIHHLLFTVCSAEPAVEELTTIQILKRWSVSPRVLEAWNSLSDAGRPIVGAIEKTLRLDEAKVRFDSKVLTAIDLGIVSRALGDELIEFYRARNLIHIHAELRDGVDQDWEIEFARRAYRRLLVFKNEVEEWISERSGRTQALR